MDFRKLPYFTTDQSHASSEPAPGDSDDAQWRFDSLMSKLLLGHHLTGVTSSIFIRPSR
jgi:hypothetical protein